MKIAVVGGGISGMAAAYLLRQEHELALFEAAPYIGGHTHTVSVRTERGTHEIDTGFMVFNDWTYPNFVKLLDRLGVASQPTRMSFSVSCESSGLEYNGTTLNTLFAQRRNLLRPRFLRMLGDILRFNREARKNLDCPIESTVDDFLGGGGYSRQFVENYLVPMSASIWSAPPQRILRYPLRFFVRFLHNHGMLNVNDRPPWRVVRGGSRRYVEKLIQPFHESIRLATPVQSIRRLADRVEIRTAAGGWEAFDQVVLAVHSDQALAMLEDPSPEERETLGAIGYQANETTLHTDQALLPRSRLAWASWNCRLPATPQEPVAVTYHSNTLQSLDSDRQYCVTLNQGHRIDPAQVIERMVYHHPQYSVQAQTAQGRHSAISGKNRTHYCGAYWGFGFHEDGLNSALRVCRAFGKDL